MGDNKLFDLSGKVAVITGGSMGLGEQMAQALASAGANVVLAARNFERCEESAQKVKDEFGVQVLPVRCDVTDPGDVKGLMQKTRQEFGQLDILVNNAGITWGAPTEDYPLDKWEQVMKVNVTGCFLAAKEAFKIMKEQTKGKIINIASVTGEVGTIEELLPAIAYSTSKGALINLTRDLAVKWAPYGINVNAIAPGWFPTHMTDKVLAAKYDLFMQYIPAKRFGSEEDLKGAVIYLASGASDYVYGHILRVDGGWTIH